MDRQRTLVDLLFEDDVDGQEGSSLTDTGESGAANVACEIEDEDDCSEDDDVQALIRCRSPFKNPIRSLLRFLPFSPIE